MSDAADSLIAANVRGYRRTARRYERLHGEIFNAHEQARLREALADALAAVTPQADGAPPRVLDFGCGSGNVTQHLLELGATVLAADVSPAFLTLVRRRFAGQPVDTFELNGRDLSGLPDASVDAAVSYSVLHHIPDYLHAIRELCRVVRPGGVLLIDHEAAPAEWAGDAQLAELRARVLEHERAKPKQAAPLRRPMALPDACAPPPDADPSAPRGIRATGPRATFTSGRMTTSSGTRSSASSARPATS